MMRLTTTFLLIALACAPSAKAWFGGSPWGMVPAVPFNDFDDPFDGFIGMPRNMGPRSILRDADRTFRRLDNMINTLVQAEDPDVGRQSSRLRVAEKEKGDKNETAIAKANVELRLRPTFEWKETEDGFLFTGAMPGLKKEDLSVEVVDSPHRGGGHYIVVSGESKKEHKTPEGEQPFEFRTLYKKFEQRVKLPEGVDKNSLNAKYEDGMLQIHIAYPKEERGERKKIAIN